ncbi:UDP-N-acetylmuramoylalanyl-D-glutamyl-2,6-diaminopimelate--D-alanyl-D-alanine ligase [Fulvimarina sp. 2208YS6-2-32]|uniref:UDP-N-acetylmuramoyl-tripeptide--D-alanyl-D-alanine ligase n=1 Tax=Fulvimarina uroteuthidis TaxID=3098149 RepID=A0ABU5I6B7_9HYPH|nr:UDP-N-acetylmuramoylalanyl-D-glutamyl-2,6-diaminopimelate--D-alanyl-D-alanine ligase [Fulvimarina sp. 2208YS6-2-32]MDY8110756.1 UDP-N-acetylmuramoylalanyl-D-glutamyl-2,6-diaminopimelate--D-alanyl-D-alanine ligase [Fulvimarina sp. 2208YS6-2-32]
MSDFLWETDVLIEAMRARPIGTMPAGIRGISIDSRTVEKGDAFFAIAGDRFDGHDFLINAQKAGAALHVVSERRIPALGRLQAPMLVVDDVLDALGRLAAAARARSKAQIVAVTGSVGKTTTKEALRHGLAVNGTVHASLASFNNHWGVPLSLARLPAETRYAIFEIGMNHPGEIRPLVKLVRPHAAIVTLIAAAHLGHFRDLDEIADAKAEIFEGLVAGGTAIVNSDDPKCMRLASAARAAGVTNVMTFGEAPGADFRMTEFEAGDAGSMLIADIAGTSVSVELAMSGKHFAQNTLAVLGAAHVAGADVEAVAARLSSWQAVKGRGQRYSLAMPSGGEITVFDDSYNANPASMRAAIDTLRLARLGENGRRIAVLGDMKELGGHSGDLHAGLAEPLAAAGVSRVFLVGEEIRALESALPEAIESSLHDAPADAEEQLLSEMRAGDAIMVKASRSIGLEKLVEGLLTRYPPRPVALDEAPPTGDTTSVPDDTPENSTR